MKALGVIVLLTAVAVALLASGVHVTTSAPTAAAPVVATPIPTPVPTPDAFSAPRWMLANGTIMAWLAFLGLLPFVVLIGIALHARHRSKLLELDHPPLRDREALHRTYDVKTLEARRGWLPESFTYSPHVRNADPEVIDAEPAALPALGGVDELLNHERGVAYGFRVDNGEPLVDARIRSLLVGGQSGFGKSSAVALWVHQLVRMNARVMLGDPDALNPEGLGTRLAGLGVQPERTAHDPQSVLRLVMDAQHELMNRKAQGGRADTRPYILVIDELPECLRVLNARDTDRLRGALELIGFSGRKHSVIAVMLSQSWMQSAIGGTLLRNLIPGSCVFRMRGDEAFRMTGLKPSYWATAGPDTLDLQPGEFYACGIDSSGTPRVRVPALPPTRAPAREGLSTYSGAAVPSGFPDSPRALPGNPPDNGLDTRPGQAVDLVRQGQTVYDAVRSVYGIQPGGRRWADAVDAVHEVLRQALT